MANVLHSSLTGAELHEPKGVASATTDQVYVADGGGSGAWTSAYQQIILTASFDAAGSTASPADSYARIYVPHNGTIVRVNWSGFRDDTSPTGRTHYLYNSTGTSNQICTWTATVNSYGTITSLSNTTVTAGSWLTFRGVRTTGFDGGCNVEIYIDRTS